MAKLKEVVNKEKADPIGLLGTFTKLTMKAGGADSLTFWIEDPGKEIRSLSKLCDQELAAINLMKELVCTYGKIKIPGSGDIFSLDFAGVKNRTLFKKTGVRLGDLYFDVKAGKEGKEYSASIVLDVPEMGEEFYELCRFCEKGQKMWIKNRFSIYKCNP